MFVPTPYYRRILYLSAVRFIAPYGRTQADLVDLLAQEGIEVTTEAVSKWENQTREPSLHTILTVCQILDIEDSVKESYNVGHLAPEKTDFGIRISGDSMEPMYHTGDVAWVHKQDSIQNADEWI